MRKHLLQDFTQMYHVDLHGNVRQNPKLSGTTHNVFGIQVGVGITIAVRSGPQRRAAMAYHRVPGDWRKEQKLAFQRKRGAERRYRLYMVCSEGTPMGGPVLKALEKSP